MGGRNTLLDGCPGWPLPTRAAAANRGIHPSACWPITRYPFSWFDPELLYADNPIFEYPMSFRHKVWTSDLHARECGRYGEGCTERGTYKGVPTRVPRYGLLAPIMASWLPFGLHLASIMAHLAPIWLPFGSIYGSIYGSIMAPLWLHYGLLWAIMGYYGPSGTLL